MTGHLIESHTYTTSLKQAASQHPSPKYASQIATMPTSTSSTVADACTVTNKNRWEKKVARPWRQILMRLPAFVIRALKFDLLRVTDFDRVVLE